MKKGTIIQIIIIVVLIAILGAIIYFTIGKNNSEEQMTQQGLGGQMPGESSSSESVETSGATEITESTSITSGNYESTTADENALLINGDDIEVDLSNITVTKTGDSDGGDNSNFYGTNSAILAKGGANVKISNATITTNANGANGVFSYGGNGGNTSNSSDGTTVTVSNSKITTTGNNAGGIMTTGGGITYINNCDVSTSGTSSAAIRTDRGGGTVYAKSGTYNTAGSGSPIIYVTAEIECDDIEGEATGSQMVVVEGKNTIAVNNSTLLCSGKGNRTDSSGELVDSCGIMLYQSMSGDADTGVSKFSSTNSILEINSNSSYYKTAPMFFVTNTSSEISLTNTELKYGSGLLLKIAGTDQWGNSGSNGGEVKFNASNQKLEGNIEVDNISTLELSLSDGSSYTGTINGDNTAKSITLKLDSSSSITLTGDTYVTTLNDEDSSYSNIDFNGYKLYVNGTAIN